MNSLELFKSLIQRRESEILDFKRDPYNLSIEDKQLDLVKDVICMYNTPRDEDAHIVIGVKDYPTTPKDIRGIDLNTINPKHLDQSSMQGLFYTKNLEIDPLPSFRVETLQYEGKMFAIIIIPINREIGPCKVLKSNYPKLKADRNQLYFRRGTDNDSTRSVEESSKILQWFQNDSTQSDYSQDGSQWENFLAASFISDVSGFDLSRKYILVTSSLKDKNLENLPVLGEIPATLVLDFDPESELSGLLYQIKERLERKRSLHIVVKGDRPTINPEGATYWFFLRGLEGRVETVEIEDYKTWKSKRYPAEIDEQLKNFAGATSLTPITCIIFWYCDSQLNLHLRDVLTSIEKAFGEAVNFVIATNSPGNVQQIKNEFEVEVINIKIDQLCSGLNLTVSNKGSTKSDEYLLPSSSGAPIKLTSKDQKWLEEELEIVHLNLDTTKPDVNESIGLPFLRGAEITWHELSLHVDVNRDKTNKIQSQVETRLERKRAWRINLYHEAGAGGTTVARRILWELHKKFPCAILKRSKPLETSERLSSLISLTGKTILLLIDSSQVSERQVDELYNCVHSNQLSVVFLHVQRRSKSLTEKDKTTYLEAVLSEKESWKFVEKLSQFKPEKRAELENLVSSSQPKVRRTAFYFGLQTFEREFLGLEPYVSSRLENLSDLQKQILLFMAISHHYAQRSIKAQAFAQFLEISPNRTVNLRKAFSSCEEAFHILIEEGQYWRTIHELVAQEVLEQGLISPGADRRTWTQKLSPLAKDFAQFCRGSSSIPSEEMLELVRRTFIYRDSSDVLGTETVARPQSFSQLLQDVPVPEGRLSILKQLTELYPKEAHLWAHLGRFYASQLKDYSEAIKCIEQAILLTNGKDHVLYHMKGMAIRYEIHNLFEEKTEVQTVVNRAKVASNAFEEARKLRPDDEHGYISEVQLLAKILDYAGRKHSNGVVGYLSTPGIEPFLLNSLERAEALLEQVRRNREGQGPNPLEADCRAKLDALYGRHDRALQIWDNLLAQRDSYHPPLRRQIVWTYLAREERSWNKLSQDNLKRIKTLLEQNLEEEPSNDPDLRLWIQAVRWLQDSPSLESVIERVSYWKINSGELDSVYYLYLLKVLSALQGSAQAKDDAERYMNECRQMARFRRNRTNSFEWLGLGSELGINSLVHHSELGQWRTDIHFWEKTDRLARVKGRVSRVDKPEQGYIEMERGLLAFYVPARSDHSRGRSENQLVNFYLGFSYDGLRAWEVKDI